ncbi:MAG: hypothetical protein Q9M18_00465 [Mariprofundaceae bacterium]|nr:hypothetical protein [Mariprofundaceae bacterium]
MSNISEIYKNPFKELTALKKIGLRHCSIIQSTTVSAWAYTHLQRCLNQHLQSRLFSKAMLKYPLWLDHHVECILGERIVTIMQIG